MRFLFISANHLPRIGGITLTIHQLSNRLLARGHAVAILTRPSDASLGEWLPWRWHGMFRRQPETRLVEDKRFAYKVYTAQEPARWVEEVCNRFAPDAIIVNVGSGMQSLAHGVLQSTSTRPVVAYFHDLGSLSLLDHSDVRPTAILAVGNTLTRSAEQKGFRSITIPPLIELRSYESSTTRRSVLLINPSPRKGVEIAWALAGCRPDVPFVFLESWRFKAQRFLALVWRARRLKNVRIRRAQTDPAKIYADAKILLAPYGAEEGFSRVIAEAQVLGIPVITTDVPTLRLTGGEGAIYVPPQAPIEAWVKALSILWDDSESYKRYAAAARLHAERRELNPEHIVELFEQTIATELNKQ